MKRLTLFTVVLLLSIPVRIFSQANEELKSKIIHLHQGKINPLPISVGGIKNLVKSDILIEGESRTIINKIFLENGFLLTEELWQNWDGSGWGNDRKEMYLYDTNNNITEQLTQDWNGTGWVNYWKVYYDPNGYKVLEQSWDGSNWVNESLYSYSYDENDKIIEMIIQDWEGSNWINSQKSTYAYDVDYNLIELLEQNWVGSNWMNDYKVTFTYEENNLIEELEQVWDVSTWVNDYLAIYTYDGSNNNTEMLYQHWDGLIWVNSQKIVFIYDMNNNIIEGLWQDWYGSNWVNFLRNEYTYDANNNLIERLRQLWDGSNWLNNYKYTYTYDANNNMIAQLRQEWNSTSWVNDWLRTYTYVVTEVEQFEKGVEIFSLAQNYPNPFNPGTKIRWISPEAGRQTIKIYDVLGNEIAVLVDEYKPAGTYEVEWIADGLASGIYFYQLKAGSYIETKKMILMK